MAKPICLIHVSHEVLRNLGELNKALQERMSDYYVFVMPTMLEEPVSIQVFYEKDFTEIQYAELRELIEKEIKVFNQNQKHEDS